MQQSIYEFNIDEKIRPSVERKLTGTTRIDTEIAALDLPKKPLIVRWSILFLRTYRRVAPSSVRNRCVFEPSCSHYSEVVFRKYGFTNGIVLTIKRLNRCKPQNGGIDLP
jgi:putative component of membrane protein insertase Oxa1/YidC/SpoIIIJ protein YidD